MIVTLLLVYFHLIEKNVRELICRDNYAEALTILLEVFENLTFHFVEDEHCNYFDDMYNPDYVCQDMMEAIIDAIKGGKFPDEEMQQLKGGLEKLKHTEAYEDYGVPYALNLWGNFSLH